MKKGTSSKLLLKKLIKQNSIASHLQSNPSVESCKRTSSPGHMNQGISEHMQELVSCKRGETFYQELKLESRVNSNELKLQSRVKYELQIESRVAQQKRLSSRLNHNIAKEPQVKANLEIQCLQIQSRVISPKLQAEILPNLQAEICPNHQAEMYPKLQAYIQINQLPVQTLQSKLLTHKLKVHSSIDGLQTSKKSHPQSQKQKQKSLPISDLIITDNKYMKRSNGLNQHDTFSLTQEEDMLKSMLYENFKVLRQQTVEQIQLVERGLELAEKDQFIEKLGREIERLEQRIQVMKQRGHASGGITPIVAINSANPSSRGRSKTPQIRKLKTVKSQQYLNKLFPPSQQQLLQRKITQQRQRIKKQKQNSLHTTQKLSKAKSAYKQLQLQLNYYENLHNQQYQNQFYQQYQNQFQKQYQNQYQKQSYTPQTPKSPLKPNYKTKYYEFLQKQKASYYLTLKKHLMVICKEIETVKMFSEQRCEELMEEIDLMRTQIRYLDVKSVEKFFFVEPMRINAGKASKDKLNKKSTLKKNYSQKLISTYSSNSLHSAIPPLSPRTPYPHSPHLFSQSPQLPSHSPRLQARSPRLKSRSPHVYQRSPHYSATSITPRAIRLKDINKVSEKSTNHSQTKIHKQINQQNGNAYIGEKRGGRDNKENLQTRKRKVDKIKREKIGIQGKMITNNEIRNKIKSKAFTNITNRFNDIRSDGEMGTQPSDEYCINSENEFRF